MANHTSEQEAFYYDCIRLLNTTQKVKVRQGTMSSGEPSVKFCLISQRRLSWFWHVQCIEGDTWAKKRYTAYQWRRGKQQDLRPHRWAAQSWKTSPRRMQIKMKWTELNLAQLGSTQYNLVKLVWMKNTYGLPDMPVIGWTKVER